MANKQVRAAAEEVGGVGGAVASQLWPASRPTTLVIGGRASGMAFVDVLISGCDADVVIVERRHRPGGHWNNAYPFVRPFSLQLSTE